MKLKDFKKQLDKLTPEELNKHLIYNSDTLSISGVVLKLVKAKTDLYYLGDDDPATLYTKRQLKEQGMDDEDIQFCEVEISKGSYYITF